MKRSPWFLLAILAGMFLQACIVHPTDGHVIAAEQPARVTFTGYAQLPNHRVDIQFRNRSTGQWTTIGSATTDAQFTQYGYAFSVALDLPSRTTYATSAWSTTQSSMLEDTYTARAIGSLTDATNDPYRTFTSAGLNCLFTQLGDGVPVLTARDACSTGNTVRIVRLRRGTTGIVSPPPVVVSPTCDDVGAPCETTPSECHGRSGFLVSGITKCVNGKSVCEVKNGEDYCTSCGGVCGGCVGNSCSVSAPCANGLSCRSFGGAAQCYADCSSRINGWCWKPDERGFEYAGCI